MTTKHNIGDVLFTLMDDNIQEVKICKIADTQRSDTEITWAVQTPEKIKEWEERRIWEWARFYRSKLDSQLFETKQELIDSL